MKSIIVLIVGVVRIFIYLVFSILFDWSCDKEGILLIYFFFYSFSMRNVENMVFLLLFFWKCGFFIVISSFCYSGSSNKGKGRKIFFFEIVLICVGIKVFLLIYFYKIGKMKDVFKFRNFLVNVG